MRKLNNDQQSVVDSVIIDLTDDLKIMEFFHQLGLTPNWLTTIGNLFRAVSVYFLVNGQNLAFLVCAFIGYFFDCFDGHFARKYNQSTKFGDYYDHVSDWIYHLILTFLFYRSARYQRLSRQNKLLLFGVMVIFTYLFMVHTGCQERHFVCDPSRSECSETLKPLEILCRDKEWIYWSRYFGTGTYVLVFYILTYMFY